MKATLTLRHRLPNDPELARIALIGFVTAPPAAIAASALAALVPVVAPLQIVALAVPASFVATLLFVRRLPRLVVSGLLGGGVAGLIALGGGLRLAMRLVSLAGARREISVGGTLFLVIGSAALGAVIGVAVSALWRLWPSRHRLLGPASGTVASAAPFADSVAVQELIHEGAGGWMNIPMFLTVLVSFGIAVAALVRFIEPRLPTWQQVRSISARLPLVSMSSGTRAK